MLLVMDKKLEKINIFVLYFLNHKSTYLVDFLLFFFFLNQIDAFREKADNFFRNYFLLAFYNIIEIL